MRISQVFGLTGLLMASVVVLAPPAMARSAEQARTCLFETGGADGNVVLLNLSTPGFTPNESQKKAFTTAMATCERKHGWTRQQTFNAGSHAGFVLRFQQADARSQAAGMTAQRRAVLIDGAQLFHTGPMLRKEWGTFNRWLSVNTGMRFPDFRKTSDFALFDAYLATLSSAHTFETK